jgi:hypothetical protein
MISEGTMVTVLFAFGSMIALDFVWAKYNIACAEKHAWQSACYAVGITLLAALMVLIYVSNPWMVIPQAAGSFVGTYIAVKTSSKP